MGDLSVGLMIPAYYYEVKYFVLRISNDDDTCEIFLIPGSSLFSLLLWYSYEYFLQTINNGHVDVGSSNIIYCLSWF